MRVQSRQWNKAGLVRIDFLHFLSGNYKTSNLVQLLVQKQNLFGLVIGSFSIVSILFSQLDVVKCIGPFNQNYFI